MTGVQTCALPISEIDDNWTESSVTWANAPVSGNEIAPSEITNSTGYYEWDITAYLKNEYENDGIVSVCLADHTGANADVIFNSKEAGNNQPELVLITDDTITFSGYYALEMNMSIYPNPTTDILNVKISGGIVNKLTIYSLTGQQLGVMHHVANHIQLSVGHYKKGVYMIKAESDSGTYVKKFIKT